MLQVDKIVNSFFDSITWLLSEDGSSRVWLVDCGDVLPIIEKVEGKIISGVLLTHAHYDHIYGLPKLLELFPECKVYTNSFGKDALASAKKNLSRYHDNPIEINESFVSVINEGSGVELFPNVVASVYETPGHNPSCLCFKVGGYFFTGDAYIPGIPSVTNLPGGNKELSKLSEDRIKTLLGNLTALPGHYII